MTSAVRPIPNEWLGLHRLQVVVSIDGLQPEHDERRKPATYERILKHIEGIRSPCTARSRGNRRAARDISGSSSISGRPMPTRG